MHPRRATRGNATRAGVRTYSRSVSSALFAVLARFSPWSTTKSRCMPFVNRACPSRRKPPRWPFRTASISARIESATSVGAAAPMSKPAGPGTRASSSVRKRYGVLDAPPETDPAISPSQQMTSFDRTGLGADPRVATTVAIVQVFPSVRQRAKAAPTAGSPNQRTAVIGAVTPPRLPCDRMASADRSRRGG
jgi:hypothetical protein